MALLFAITLYVLAAADATYNWCNLYNGGCDVDGGWSSWGDWSECSEACGGGTQSHFRSCTNPTPAYGGAHCVGEGEKERECNTNSCKEQILDFPGTYRDWVQFNAGNSNITMDAFSICTWFKLSVLGQHSYQNFLNFRARDETRNGGGIYFSETYKEITLCTTGPVGVCVNADVELDIDNWYHLCGTFSVTKGPLIYLDAERVGETLTVDALVEASQFVSSQAIRALTGTYYVSNVDAYEKDSGFRSSSALEGALKNTFMTITELTQEDVTTLASQFCGTDIDSVAGKENILVSWADLLYGKYNGDLVKTDVECPDQPRP